MGDETPATGGRTAPWFTLAVAAVLIGFFIWLTYQMFIVRIGASDAQWARSLTIYASIEAFALAAAGVLLGTQVQAGRVRAAEIRADSKEKEAERAKAAKAEAEKDIVGYRLAVRDAQVILSGAGANAGEIGDASTDADRAEPPEARIRAALRRLDFADFHAGDGGRG